MPDSRSHRGPHPADSEIFAASEWPKLQQAVRELSWLLSHGYASKSSLKLVGDRHGLAERQRRAVASCSCSDGDLCSRLKRQLAAETLSGGNLLIDGYNLLTTIEAALGGGVILHARDGCYRDLASVHGTYRRVEETVPALHILVKVLETLAVKECLWLLDSPVSNSGRLRQLIRQVAAETDAPFQVELVPDPDKVLRPASDPVATADSGILDNCRQWFNLARYAVDTAIPAAYVVRLCNLASEPQRTQR